MIALVPNGEKIVELLTQQIRECQSNGIDPSYLLNALQLVQVHTEGVRVSLPYKVARNDYYGEELDDVGMDELFGLIDEVGFEEVKAALGDGVASILSGGS